MSEVKDPKIKLFGKTIELPENPTAAVEDGEPGSARSCEPAAGDISNQNPACSSDSVVEDSSFFSGDAEKQESIKTLSVPDQAHANKETRPEHPKQLKSSNTAQPPTTESNEPCNSDASMKTSKNDEDRTESTTSNNNSNAEALKKPDKILPCPRCNSMDTKFCYFNNYNVNQPRYFCKNCQRYWTSGGTMRNVPVGAGRRKNKIPSISQFHHLTAPESLNLNGMDHHSNGTVLTFGSDSPRCESIGPVLNISKNGPRKAEESKENGDNDHKSSEPIQLCNSFSYPGLHWPYPWNPVQWGGPAGSFPGPLYSATQPYWGWSVPWVITPAPPTSGPNSRTLGKHSRDDDVDVKENSKEDVKNCLWVPKTSRMDDPGEAAKSSIWERLGMKSDEVGGGGIFKAFQNETKGDEKVRVLESSTVLQANPAALSRSLSFNESS